MQIDKKQVEYVARLARLTLTEEEKETYTSQLNDILDYAAKLDQLDTKDIVPTAHVLPLKNVLREDKTGHCLDQERVLANAPEKEEGMFKVPRVIE